MIAIAKNTSNLLGLTTDCPKRQVRGYLGEDSVRFMAAAKHYNDCNQISPIYLKKAIAPIRK